MSASFCFSSGSRDSSSGKFSLKRIVPVGLAVGFASGYFGIGVVF
ncbi:MAG: hypothetical protein ACP5UO_05790 [Thermoplasmata archaeon]